MDSTNGTHSSLPHHPFRADEATAHDPRDGQHRAPAGAAPARRRRVAVVSGAVAAAAIIGIGSSLAIAHGSGIAGTAVAAVQVDAAAGSNAQPTTPGYGGSTRLSPWGGSNGGPSGGNGQLQPGSQGLSTSTLGTATAAQEVGVVDIDTVLDYGSGEAAGTGLVLTSSGEILTNNHVVEGSTTITVTIVTTGQSYPATVVGTDATDDVAVIQLTDASGLGTANLASAPVQVGDPVTGVGNAGGTGGTPSASPGNVTAANQTITTQAEDSAAAETLSGLIETNADIEAGDSGGPLFDSADQVVGIDTAAEQGGYTTAGYAIPISTAVAIAGQIDSGQASATVTIGYPAFLGVQVSGSTGGGSAQNGYRYQQPTTTAGALISGVVSGAPADSAGLTAGDTITGIDDITIGSASALTSALAGHAPGQSVTISWIDAAGAAHSGSVTLASGPAA